MMGEATAPTAATTPAAPATPPSAPEPPAATPKPTTPAPNTSTTREKQTEARRVAAAAKLMEQADSARQSAAPTQAKEATPTGDGPEPQASASNGIEAKPKPDDEDDKPHEPTNAEWKELRNRKARVDKREQAVVAKEAELQQRDAQYAQWDRTIQHFQQQKLLLKKDPRAFLDYVIKESGVDYAAFYEQLANTYIEQGKPDARVAANERRVQELEQQLAEKEQQTKLQQQTAIRQQATNAFVSVAATADFPGTQWAFKAHGGATVMEDALAVQATLRRELRREPSDAELFKRLDEEYTTHYRNLIAGGPAPVAAPSGVNSEAPNGAAAQQLGTVQPGNAVAPKAPTTLTNGAAAVRSSPGRKLSAAERLAAAAELMPDLPRPRGI